MKKYIFDNTQVRSAEVMLQVALKNIHAAREFLQEVLDGNNVANISGVAGKDGFIPVEDTFNEEQLCFIRDEFACIMEQTNNANGELDIINKCCRLLEDPEFESYEEWQKNTSGTWCEKKIEEE